MNNQFVSDSSDRLSCSLRCVIVLGVRFRASPDAGVHPEGYVTAIYSRVYDTAIYSRGYVTAIYSNSKYL